MVSFDPTDEICTSKFDSTNAVNVRKTRSQTLTLYIYIYIIFFFGRIYVDVAYSRLISLLDLCI